MAYFLAVAIGPITILIVILALIGVRWAWRIVIPAALLTAFAVWAFEPKYVLLSWVFQIATCIMVPLELIARLIWNAMERKRDRYATPGLDELGRLLALREAADRNERAIE